MNTNWKGLDLEYNLIDAPHSSSRFARSNKISLAVLAFEAIRADGAMAKLISRVHQKVDSSGKLSDPQTMSIVVSQLELP